MSAGGAGTVDLEESGPNDSDPPVPNVDEVPSTEEWVDFRRNVVDHRHKLERTLRREFIHDARSATARRHNVAVRDLADEALCQVLDDWRSKPGATSPYQWMLKRGLHLLDDALDREALAAESRAEERARERALLSHNLLTDDEERTRWLEVAELAAPPADGLGGAPSESPRDPQRNAPVAEPSRPRPDFDRLASDPSQSSPELRLAQAETLLQLERAMVRLPELRRRALSHRYLDDLTVEDVAYLLDISRDQVQVELQSGLKALRLELTPPG